MKKLYSWITEHTGLVLVVFLLLTVVCAALKPLIGVNYDMNDYLPPDSVSTVARDALYDGLGDLYDGAAELVSGLGELKDGSEEMKDGTTEFQDKTSDIDDQIEDKIDELIDGLSGKDYEPVSFTSSKNTDIGLVQFAIHTEAIKKADTTEEETEAETETESETILSRVKSLFS